MACPCKKAVNIFESASTPYRIGKTGENVYQEIEFNFSKWLSEYPDAKIDLLIRVPKNGFYLLAEGITEPTYLWKPSAFDLANPGRAAVMARMSSGEVRAKSDPIPFEIVRSMDYNLDISEPGPTRPSLMDKWIEDIYEAAVRYPKIGEDDYWYVWDVIEGDWVKTDTYAGGKEGSDSIVYVTVEEDGKASMSASEIATAVSNGKYPIFNFDGILLPYLSMTDDGEAVFGITGADNGAIGVFEIVVNDQKGARIDSANAPTKTSDLINDNIKEPVYLTVTTENGVTYVDKTPAEIDALSAAGYDVHLRLSMEFAQLTAVGDMRYIATLGQSAFYGIVRYGSAPLIATAHVKADKTVSYVLDSVATADDIDWLADQISKIGTVFTLKGGVATANDLPQTDNNIGDVWYVESVSAGFIWITSDTYPGGYWEELGETVDLSTYAEKTWVQTMISLIPAVHYDVAQTLTPAQQEQARGNIGIEFMTVSDVDEILGDIDDLPLPVAAEWQNVTDTVKNYLTQVSYDPTDYTTSRIADYAPASAADAQAASAPVGKTLSLSAGTLNRNGYNQTVNAGDNVLYNDVPNSVMPFSVTDANGVLKNIGTLKPTFFLRQIKAKTVNVRDLGGWPCDGGTVKYGMLFRGGNPNAQDQDVFLHQLGILYELDLRGTTEATQNPSPLKDYVGYSVFNSYAWYSISDTLLWRQMLGIVFDCVKTNRPVYFHCAAGADRTGTLACVLEALLGMLQSDIDKDYELTSFYTGTADDTAARRRNETEWRNLIDSLNAKSGATFRDRAVSFCVELGFTADDLNAFRTAMIDGTPELIVLPSQTYTVTTDIAQNVTFIGSTTPVEEGDPYTAAVSVPQDYMALVTVTMGGSNVTASVYSNGTISIPSVTGNVIITARARFTGNYVPVVGYTDNTRWSTTDGSVRTANGYVGVNEISIDTLPARFTLSGIDWSADTNCVFFMTLDNAYATSGGGYLNSAGTAGTGVTKTLNGDGTLVLDFFVGSDGHGGESRPTGFKVSGKGAGANAMIVQEVS